MMMIAKLAWWLTVLAIANCVNVRYDNYTLYRIVPQSDVQIKVLQELQNNEDLDFWVEPTRVDAFVNVVSSPSIKSSFENFLKVNDIEAKITIGNIQNAIENQKVNRYTSRNLRTMTWDAYYSLEDINQWLDDLAATYPNTVTPLIGGTTYEGREIRGIKISYGSGRRAIFLEGGIHSREWVSPATLTYITNELLHSSDVETRAAAEGFDWFIFPVTNPDGYVWTFGPNRMWRKNRRPVGQNYGVDLNRNWNNNWLVVGASINPASDTYAGPGPFSEIETRTLSTFISGVADQIEMYLSFHSFLQLLMVPYGNTTEPLDNYWDAVTIGRRAVGSLAVRYGTQYVVGNIAEAIYQATGGSVDWVKGHLKIPLVYIYELRDRGEFGFLLPAEQIIPNCEETMDSLLALIREGRSLGYMNSSPAPGFSASLLIAAFVVWCIYNV